MPGVAGVGEGFEQAGPEAGGGPAAELARGGVGLAELRRQVGPGREGAAGLGGEPEDGVQTPARGADGAPGGVAVDEGRKDGPLVVGERFPGALRRVAAVGLVRSMGVGRQTRHGNIARTKKRDKLLATMR